MSIAGLAAAYHPHETEQSCGRRSATAHVGLKVDVHSAAMEGLRLSQQVRGYLPSDVEETLGIVPCAEYGMHEASIMC